jgi:nicotinate-nucleotide pyrophosphorylase (carboxylating)
MEELWLKPPEWLMKVPVKSIAETGVDLISVGAITHSVKALDISLEVTRE